MMRSIQTRIFDPYSIRIQFVLYGQINNPTVMYVCIYIYISHLPVYPSIYPSIHPSSPIHSYIHKTSLAQPINQSITHLLSSNSLNLHPAVPVPVALCNDAVVAVVAVVAVAFPLAAPAAIDPVSTVPCDLSSTSQSMACAPGLVVVVVRRCRRPVRPKESWP